MWWFEVSPAIFFVCLQSYNKAFTGFNHNFGLFVWKLCRVVFATEEWNSIILQGNLPHWVELGATEFRVFLRREGLTINFTDTQLVNRCYEGFSAVYHSRERYWSELLLQSISVHCIAEHNSSNYNNHCIKNLRIRLNVTYVNPRCFQDILTSSSYTLGLQPSLIYYIFSVLYSIAL